MARSTKDFVRGVSEGRQARLGLSFSKLRGKGVLSWCNSYFVWGKGILSFLALKGVEEGCVRVG